MCFRSGVLTKAWVRLGLGAYIKVTWYGSFHLSFFVLVFQVLCIVVAITINYFYLAAFGWMVMEGVMLYLKVVKVFNVTTTTKYFYGFAWGNKFKSQLFSFHHLFIYLFVYLFIYLFIYLLLRALFHNYSIHSHRIQ